MLFHTCVVPENIGVQSFHGISYFNPRIHLLVPIAWTDNNREKGLVILIITNQPISKFHLAADLASSPIVPSFW